MKKLLSCIALFTISFTGFVYSSCEKQQDISPGEEVLTTVDYTSSDAIIFNPERGFYKYTACNPGSDGPIELSTLQAFRAGGYSLIYRIYYLKDFRDRDLTPDVLETMSTDMELLREAGMKCILRIAYSENPEEPDAPLSTIEMHLDRLKPWFAENYDVIAVMQAGFIGAWGEWYYTSNNLNSQGAQAAVLNKILEVLPEERMVQVRTPKYKTDYVQNKEALKLAEAFGGTKKARIGHHNDCFLASENDYGTYENVGVEKKYINADAQYVPVGGETCPPSGVEPADCDKAEEEMRFLRWTYLNDDYYNGVNDRWKDQGCLDDIQRELGYRFELKSGMYSPEVSPGHTLNLKLTIRNSGYASLFNPRLVELILIHGQTGASYRLQLEEDPRFWKPSADSELDIRAGLPADIAQGKYQLYLSLPDPEPELYEKPSFSIQLANEGLWQPTSGYNDLLMPLTISDNGTTDRYDGDLVFHSN